MGDENSEDRGFSVVDRRASAEEQESGSQPPQEDSGLPQVDFSSFCLSLATSALYHLGVIGDPETGTARQQVLTSLFLVLDHDAASVLVVDELHSATELSEDRLALW